MESRSSMDSPRGTGIVEDPEEGDGHERDPLETYREAARRHGSALAQLRAQVRRIEAGRLGSFLAAAIVGLLYRELPIGATASLSISAAAALVFLVLVVRHRRVRTVLLRSEAAEALARLGQHRLRRQWDGVARQHAELGYVDPLLDPNPEPDEGHPYVEDLDLFGEASVRALLGPTPTPTGRAALRAWLSAPAAPDEVRARQGAVRTLASDFEGREALATEALLVESVGEPSWARFRAWLREPALFGDGGSPPPASASASPAPASASPLPRWSIAAARGLPPVTLTLFALDVGAGMAVPVWTWVLPLAVQALLSRRWARALNGYFARAVEPSGGLRRYHGLLRAWERHPAENARLAGLRARLTGEDGVPASDQIRRLERWLDAAESRRSLLHALFGWAVLWDVHVGWGLEAWRRDAGSHVEEWLEALGELEALSALAALAHDHPSWCWPEVREGEPGFEAEGLGHPLLPESVLRTSDVRVEGPGRFLLVTGSNMSGKSTLLRSIGLAAVLGQAGSVVCARRATLTPLRTFTSMRVHDSLTAGVSLFMAELKRLKALVDEADRGARGGPALLYLIDEVLQGTNSDERRIAARRIVAHLLDAWAIGAVTTHDLTLHEEPRLDHAATKVHFRERVGGAEGAAVLTFDYQLRPGLATSRNALKLLEIVGLGEPDAEGRG